MLLHVYFALLPPCLFTYMIIRRIYSRPGGDAGVWEASGLAGLRGEGVWGDSRLRAIYRTPVLSIDGGARMNASAGLYNGRKRIARTARGPVSGQREPVSQVGSPLIHTNTHKHTQTTADWNIRDGWDNIRGTRGGMDARLPPRPEKGGLGEEDGVGRSPSVLRHHFTLLDFTLVIYFPCPSFSILNPLPSGAKRQRRDSRHAIRMNRLNRRSRPRVAHEPCDSVVLCGSEIPSLFIFGFEEAHAPPGPQAGGMMTPGP